MTHETRGWEPDVLSAAEVHLRSDQLGHVAARLLLLVRDSSVVREFVAALPLSAKQDLADYLESASMSGRYWEWREPLTFLKVSGEKGEP